MRNWHFNIGINCFAINSSCRKYITYEELTLTAFKAFLRTFVLRNTLPMRNWHSYPGKYLLLCSEIHYLWGIDTFLEVSVLIAFYFLQARNTLPMRNWHFSFVSITSIIIEIHYLWGIDTHNHLLCMLHLHVKYITYEELTRVSAFSTCFCFWSEIHYLWGIDTY